MTYSAVRLSNGNTLQIRTGVLTGAGPVGPVGPVGPPGLTGPVGPQGPPGEVNDVGARMSSTSEVITAWVDPPAVGWTALPWESLENNEVLDTMADAYRFSFKEAGSYLLNCSFKCASGDPAGNGGEGASNGSRAVRLVNLTAGETQVGGVKIPPSPTGDTMFEFTMLLHASTGVYYQVQASSDDSYAIAWRDRSIEFIRIGSGQRGIQGPLGPAGPTGPKGPAGPPGEAQSGFSSFDGIAGGPVSENDPGGTPNTTPDLGIPYPDGLQKPYIPWFFFKLATYLEKLVVARYADLNTRNTKRPTPVDGEVAYMNNNGALVLRSLNTDVHLGQVIVSTSASPGLAPPGTIWVKI